MERVEQTVAAEDVTLAVALNLLPIAANANVCPEHLATFNLASPTACALVAPPVVRRRVAMLHRLVRLRLHPFLVPSTPGCRSTTAVVGSIFQVEPSTFLPPVLPS